MMPIALPANRIYAPRRLTKPVIPQPGESLRGLVARACFDNFLPNSWGLLKPLGLRNRNLVNISELDDISTNCLATALGVDADEVARRRYPFLGEGCRSFFGIEVSRLRIATRVRRFAPATLVSKPWHLACLIHDSREAERSAPALPLGARRGQAPSPEFFTALGSMGFSG